MILVHFKKKKYNCKEREKRFFIIANGKRSYKLDWHFSTKTYSINFTIPVITIFAFSKIHIRQLVVSARKYRPRQFKDVVGRKQLPILAQCHRSNHLASALLFTGYSGQAYNAV
jgi:hypothetical protein